MFYAATGGGMGPGTIAALRGAARQYCKVSLTRFSVAPRTLMDRAIALPTGTDHLRENSASRSRGFGLPSRAATGTKSFTLNCKHNRSEAEKKPEWEMISRTKSHAVAAY